MKTIKEIANNINENMIDFSNLKNISKCIKYCESLEPYICLQCKLSSPYKREYDIIVFNKDIIFNKVTSIEISKNNSNVLRKNLNFSNLQTHDKELIDKNIEIPF